MGLFLSVMPPRVLVLEWTERVALFGGLGWQLVSLSYFFLEGSSVAASAAVARQSSTASAMGAVGTRATPLPELAKPSFPPKPRPSGQHLNIGKLFGTSQGSTDLQEKFIQKVTFSPQKKCNFVYKIQYLHTTRWIYSKSLQMFSTYLFKTL